MIYTLSTYHITDEGMNSKIRIILKYYGFLAKSIDEVWYLLK